MAQFAPFLKKSKLRPGEIQIKFVEFVGHEPNKFNPTQQNSRFIIEINGVLHTLDMKATENVEAGKTYRALVSPITLQNGQQTNQLKILESIDTGQQPRPGVGKLEASTLSDDPANWPVPDFSNDPEPQWGEPKNTPVRSQEEDRSWTINIGQAFNIASTLACHGIIKMDQMEAVAQDVANKIHKAQKTWKPKN